MTEVTVAAPEATTPVVRTEEGRFVKGRSGNPNGRPKGRKNHLVQLQQDLEIAVREHLDVTQITRIIKKICEKAEDGNVAAAKLILDKVIANAKDSEDVEGGGRVVVFRIENATFAAQAEEHHNKSKPIDVEVIEISPPTKVS